VITDSSKAFVDKGKAPKDDVEKRFSSVALKN
jgi:hypothetical protein